MKVNNLFNPIFYRQDKGDKIAWEIINMIPKGINTRVTVSGDLLVPFSVRNTTLEFLDDRYNYYDVDYIFIHNRNMYIGAGHYQWDQQRAEKELQELFLNPEWKNIYQKDTYYLFKRKD